MQQNKVCPECGAEYTPRAQMCADCGVPLEWLRERAPLPPGAPGDPWLNLPPGVAGLVIEDGQPAIAEYLELLIEHRIPSAVLPVVRRGPGGADEPVWDGQSVGYKHGLYVPREEYPDAFRIVMAEHDRRNPGLAETPYIDFPEEGCPACGSPLPEDAERCPDCGLPFMN